jgi:hypothetical protein
LRIVGVDRHSGPRQREDAVEGKRFSGLERRAGDRFGAQPLDGIAVETADDGHGILRRCLPGGQCSRLDGAA